MTIDVTLSFNLNHMPAGQSLTLYEDKVIALTTSSNMGTLIICAGGTTVPVKETKAQVEQLIMEAKNGKSGRDSGAGSSGPNPS